MRRLAAALIAVALAGVASPAFADAAACTSAAERGQKARANGKLIDAEREFLACSSADCPSVVAKDCGTWAAEVLAATPTIVIDAKDANGQDVGDATLTIDGNVVASQLDGKAIPVDPGSHRLEVATNGTPKRAATQTFIAKEAEKARPIHLVLDRAAETAAAPTSASGHSIGPWIVTGVGAAFLIGGLVLYLTRGDYPANCNAERSTCFKTPDETQQDFADDQQKAGNIDGKKMFGIASMIGGGVVMAGGLVWLYIDRSHTTARTTVVAPWIAGGSGGLVMHGTF